MTDLYRCLSAEILKLKRTLALWMTIIAPGIVVFLQVLVILKRSSMLEKSSDPWASFSGNIGGLWAVLMLPLFITLEAALVSNLEHSERQWKQLLALPVPRWSIYLSKFLVVQGLVILSSIALFAMTIGGALMLGVLIPKVGLHTPLPWANLLILHSKILFTAVFVVAIHHWVSLRWQNFTVAVSFGISAVVISFIMINSQIYGLLYPWSIPGRVISAPAETVRQLLAISLAGATAALVAGAWDFSRQEIS